MKPTKTILFLSLLILTLSSCVKRPPSNQVEKKAQIAPSGTTVSGTRVDPKEEFGDEWADAPIEVPEEASPPKQKHKIASPKPANNNKTKASKVTKQTNKKQKQQVAKTKAINGVPVADIQAALNEHGAKLKVDGTIGKQTTQAIKKFQANNRLKKTGNVDMATLRKLGLS